MTFIQTAVTFHTTMLAQSVVNPAVSAGQPCCHSTVRAVVPPCCTQSYHHACQSDARSQCSELALTLVCTPAWPHHHTCTRYSTLTLPDIVANPSSCPSHCHSLTLPLPHTATPHTVAPSHRHTLNVRHNLAPPAPCHCHSPRTLSPSRPPHTESLGCSRLHQQPHRPVHLPMRGVAACGQPQRAHPKLWVHSHGLNSRWGGRREVCGWKQADTKNQQQNDTQRMKERPCDQRL